MDATLDLPPLSPEEAAHCARVRAHLASRLTAAGGTLPFPAYMAEVLYAPGLGYYAAGARKFGAGGDFITAPEVSPLFGGCLARQVAEVLGTLRSGGNDPVTVVEYGAGTGALAVTVLQALERLGELPDTYAIIEVSPELRERQQVAIAALDPALSRRVVWWPGHAAAPWQGVLLANELLDALPTERVVVGPEGPQRVGVRAAADGATLIATSLSMDAALGAWWQTVCRELPAPPAPGSQLEACLAAGPWVTEALARMTAGVALCIDYGLPRAQLYSPSRPGGTFGCFFRHRRHDDAFLHPGLQDLTAWVDFTGVAEAGLAAGARVAGFATQAQFLVACGLDRVFEEALAAATGGAGEPAAAATARLAQGAQRLVLPQEMGERFKVLALAKGYDAALSGFAQRDLAATL